MRGGQPDFDGIRRKYLSRLHQMTGRDTIVYSTDFLAGGGPQSTIILEDMQGMMEVCRDLNGPGLDLIHRNRRQKVRYERRDDIHQAFLDLGCALICWRYVQRLC